VKLDRSGIALEPEHDVRGRQARSRHGLTRARAPLGFSAFLVFGVVLVLVGANQAALARDLALDLSRSGLLGSALVLGIGMGVVGAGPLVDATRAGRSG
jgi:hypothetical protein